MEDVWRGEAQDLLSQIAQLQEENKQLMTNLSHKDVNFSEEEFQKHEGKWGSAPMQGGRPFLCSLPTSAIVATTPDADAVLADSQSPLPSVLC